MVKYNCGINQKHAFSPSSGTVSKYNFWRSYVKPYFISKTRVGISGTTAKSRKRKFVPSSHPGPFAVVASSRKRQTKLGTLACFDFCKRMS